MASLHTLARPSLASKTIDYICQTCRRSQSSFRRTRKMQRIAPNPDFLPSKTEIQDHIIFNPPSSSPNIYHTPQKFLPANDPRRKLSTLAPTSAATPPSTPSGPKASGSGDAPLPNPVRRQYEKKYHLSPEQVEEIRRLRAEDPRTWTRVRLAEKFECSQFFVSLCCCAPEIKAERERDLEQIKSKWGRRKREAREERVERKQIWGVEA